MKKIIYLVILGISINVFSQNTESISISYSILPTTFTLKPTLFWYSDDKDDPFKSGFRMIGSWDDLAPNPLKYFLGVSRIKKIKVKNIPILDWHGLEKINYHTTNLTYKRRLKKNTAIGVTFVYGRYDQRNKDPEKPFDQCKSTILSLAIDFTKIYGRNNRSFYFYNSFILYPLILENTEFMKSNELVGTHNLKLYAYELRLLGIKGQFSKSTKCYTEKPSPKLSYFADIGFGYMGLLRTGVSYDF
jgi:hypothetical protein